MSFSFFHLAMLFQLQLCPANVGRSRSNLRNPGLLFEA